MKEVIVSKLPKCDVCDETAHYDAQVDPYRSWMFLCDYHFEKFNCRLGLGRGQKLKEVEQCDEDVQAMR